MRFQKFICKEEMFRYYHPLMYRQLTPLWEMFNSKGNRLHIVQSASFDFLVEFEIEDIPFIFWGKQFDDNTWSIAFDVSSRKDDSDIFDLMKSQTLPMATFNTVMDCVKLLVKEKNVKFIVFNSDVPEMIQFYDKLKKYIEKTINSQFLAKIVNGEITTWKYEVK